VRRTVLRVLPLVIAAALLYAFIPRHAKLRDFDPACVARLKTAMWRDDYEKDYLALFRSLYLVNAREYGFSPWDSVRLSYYAATAAKRFQPTRSRDAAHQALPALERYYGIIRRRSGESFNERRNGITGADWKHIEESLIEAYGLLKQAVREENDAG